MMMKKLAAVLAVVSAVSYAAAATPVYSWKSGNGVTSYSDTPKNLRINQVNVLNVRTQTAHTAKQGMPAVPESLADQQALLSQKIAAQNRQVEEQNARIAADMEKAKQENCQTAQSNRKLAEGARNRDQLVQKYDADIQRYCN
ncbi:MAG: DUF4124 domain-containing protein [Conchiformibius sp.]|nr:DUF4124 domain-containing protein [Conchiformibius sp.]